MKNDAIKVYGNFWLYKGVVVGCAEIADGDFDWDKWDEYADHAPDFEEIHANHTIDELKESGLSGFTMEHVDPGLSVTDQAIRFLDEMRDSDRDSLFAITEMTDGALTLYWRNQVVVGFTPPYDTLVEYGPYSVKSRPPSDVLAPFDALGLDPEILALRIEKRPVWSIRLTDWQASHRDAAKLCRKFEACLRADGAQRLKPPHSPRLATQQTAHAPRLGAYALAEEP